MALTCLQDACHKSRVHQGIYWLGEVNMQYVSTDCQLAEMFIKPFSSEENGVIP